MTWIHKLIFALATLPALLRAAVRLSLNRRRRFDALADAMREVPAFRSAYLSHPAWLAGLTGRLTPFLPPYGYGLCFKRSLLLLHLWSRCGLSPTLHLGTEADRRDRRFHAWVTCEPDGPSTDSAGHQEIWRG